MENELEGTAGTFSALENIELNVSYQIFRNIELQCYFRNNEMPNILGNVF